MTIVTSKRRLIALGALVVMAMVTIGAMAQQTLDRSLERTYRVIQPQKVETGERIEVIDFFWYG